jgi:GntR family transcriptional regulator
LYRQICELLHREITAGHWSPGERLPVEAELACHLGVAVGTLRKALAQLEHDGLLERRQGSGTYVKRTPSEKAVYQFFHLELTGGGGIPGAETLSVRRNTNSHIASALNLKEDSSPLWRIRRRRLLNNCVVAAEEIWLDAIHCETLVPGELHESLYMHYREHFDFWIDRVEDRLDCTGVPDWVSRTLSVPEKQVMTRVERRSWCSQNEPKEFSWTWFMSNRCRYIARW